MDGPHTMSDETLAGRPPPPGPVLVDARTDPSRAKGRRRADARRPRWRGLFHKVAKSHYTHLAAGLLLVLTAVLEIVDGMLVELSMKPESHHALLALGGVLVARSIVDIIEGMEYLDEANEEQPVE